MNSEQQNRRLKKKLFEATPEQVLKKILSRKPGLYNLVKMQLDRQFSYSTKGYTDFQKAIGFNIYYQGGRKGYRSVKGKGTRNG